MDPYYSSSSDDEAPEAVGLSTAKAASKHQLQQERAAAKTAKDAKKAANRKRDEALKAQKAERPQKSGQKSKPVKSVPEPAPVESPSSDEESGVEEDEDALPAALVQQLAARDAEQEDDDSEDEATTRPSRKRPSNLTTFDSDDDDDEVNYSTAKSIASELEYLYGSGGASGSDGASDDDEVDGGIVDKSLGGHLKVVALNKQTAPPAPSSSAISFANRHLAKKGRRAPVAKNLAHNLQGQPALNFKHKTGSTNKSGKALAKPSAKRRRVK